MDFNNADLSLKIKEILSSSTVCRDNNYSVKVSYEHRGFLIITNNHIYICPTNDVKERISDQILSEKEIEYHVYIFHKTGLINEEGIVKFQRLVNEIEKVLEGQDYSDYIVDSRVEGIEWGAEGTREEGFVEGAMITYVITTKGVK